MSTLAFCACYVHGTNILLVVSIIRINVLTITNLQEDLVVHLENPRYL